MKKKYSKFENFVKLYEYLKENINWLCICAEYEKMGCRIHSLRKNFFSTMENKKIDERRKILGSYISFELEIYMFKELEDYFF